MPRLSPLALLLCFSCGTDKPPSDSEPGGIDTAIGGLPTDSADGGAQDTQGNDSGPTDSGASDSGITDTGTEAPVDLDGDGFTVEDGDCNDMDSSRHPAREEVCDGIDNNCDGIIDEDAASLWFLDFDGDGHGTEAFTYEGCTPLDGYVSLSDDCDDTSELAFPGGTEVCDTIDNNCDGTIDEDVTETYFLDEDEDSFGDAGFTIEACSLPAGYADNSEDCHDLDGLIHPGADELCDGADNDCDGEIDEDSATDTLTFHRDADADGFGAMDDSTSACAVPDGFVADSSDCDDHDDDIHPDATEACDGEDNDCDGEIDEYGATGATTWYPDDDGDSYGSAAGAMDGCTSPPAHVSVAGDCDDTEPLTSPAGIEHCNGIDDDCDGETDEAGATGGTMWYLDADRDGYGDPSGELNACEPPLGYVGNLDDCDDHDDDTHPGATEFCDGEDNNCDGETDEAGATGAPTWYPDSDGDSYGTTVGATAACSAPPGSSSTAGDCDDTTPSISPAATETCNDIDDDCDGETDEAGATGGTSWYLDSDGDGYGDPSTEVTACESPSGYVGNLDDCDDHDDDTHPTAAEFCDGEDNNCDGETDEDGATGAPTWYPDSDGDTYGASAGSTVACSAPPGFVSLPGDCDDTTSSISPAATETCNDIDDDCNGVTDEDGTPDGTTWYLDSDGDGYGTPLTDVVSCELPSGYTTSSDDCNDDDATSYPGATEIADDGIDQDCNGEDLVSSPFTGSEAGWYHANYGGVYEHYNPSTSYNGSISCPTTCEHYGMTAAGARFVCNVAHGSSSSPEGCTPSTEGMYGTENCGKMVRDLEITSDSGNPEDCAGGNIWDCATASCSEGVTWHSLECQCI